MSKCFEIGTKVIVQSDVLEKMGGDPYVNNCWEVIDTSRDREDNVMHWLKNTETEWEPEQFFYFEELHELQDLTDLRVSELIAIQPEKMQELYAYIEHAENDLLCIFKHADNKDQNMVSVIDYLSSAYGLASNMDEKNPSTLKNDSVKTRLLDKLLALRDEFYTNTEDDTIDDELLEICQRFCDRHNIEVIHEDGGEVSFKEKFSETKEEDLPEYLKDIINKELNKRQYVITWKPGCYATDELCKVVSLDYFTKDNGFDADEAENIHNLDIGDACYVGAGDCFVTRLFDKASFILNP